jgi:hypothetical protein
MKVSENAPNVYVPPALLPAIEKMLETFFKKSADYSVTDDWSSNFLATAWFFGVEKWEACDFNEVQKLARLRALRERGTEPANESVHDTYLDKANYALYAYALLLAAEGEVVATGTISDENLAVALGKDATPSHSPKNVSLGRVP